MSRFLKLNSYITERNSRGMVVAAPSVTIGFPDGTTVDFPVPFTHISGSLAVVPRMTIDGDIGVRVDLAHWSPAHVTVAQTALFPADFDDQATAVRVGRAFDVDPATSWNDTFNQKVAWLREWGPANGVQV